MSDTPRTDAVYWAEYPSAGYTEMVDHAKKLERENARLRAALEFMVERGICTESVMKKARDALKPHD